MSDALGQGNAPSATPEQYDARFETWSVNAGESILCESILDRSDEQRKHQIEDQYVQFEKNLEQMKRQEEIKTTTTSTTSTTEEDHLTDDDKAILDMVQMFKNEEEHHKKVI
jgi:hypothetical protein